MPKIKLQGPASGSDLGTVTVVGAANSASVTITAFRQTDASVMPLIAGPQAEGETATVDTSRLTNVSATQWRIVGGPNLGTAATQDLTGLGGQRVEVETISDQGVQVSPALLVHSLMMHDDHNLADAALVAIASHDKANKVAGSSGDWSDPATWIGGSAPMSGDTVLIPHNVAVIFDVDAPNVLIPQLRVDGTFSFATDTNTHLYVRDFIGDRMSTINIGNSLTDRVQINVQAAVTFEGQTPLDLATDPELFGRGLVTLGALNIFGAEKLNHSRAAFPEKAGSSAIVLEEFPVGWGTGDQIIIGATDTLLPYNTGTGMADVAQDEIVTVTATVGNIVYFSPPLVNDHNNQNPRSDRSDIRPMVQLRAQSRNVIIQSETLTPVTQRGHIMTMHMHSRTDLWDVGLIELGRTDKSRPAGGRVFGDMFEYFDKSLGANGEITQVPMTADANIRGRYSFHTHIVGYNHGSAGRPQPTAVNVTIEGNPGWGFTHHDCEMDIRGCSTFRVFGCGFVAEQGGELGEWHDLSVMQSTAVNRTDGWLQSTAKGHHGLTGGVAGDFFNAGYGFGYRGRAITATKCIATTCTEAHVFWHRGMAPGQGLFDSTNPPRARMDLKETGLFNGNPLVSTELWQMQDYPIVHFADCGAIACLAGTFVSKQTPAQNHDFNVIWKGFFSHGTRLRGMFIEYVATYILQDIDVVMGSEAFSNGFGQQGISIGNNCYQIALVRPRVEGCANAGMVVSGVVTPPLSDGGTNADTFNAATEPRFWVIGYESVSNGLRLNYTGGGTKAFDQIAMDVPDLLGDYIDYDQVPSETFPDIVGTWNGAFPPSVTSRADNTDGAKINAAPLPMPIADKVWEDTPFPDGPLQIYNTALNQGYSQFNGNDVLVQRDIISHVLTGRPSKFTGLWQSDAPTQVGADNGPITLVNEVTTTDELLIVAPGQSATFNAVAGSSGGLGQYEADPGDFVAPDYGKLEIDYGAGTATYTARPGVKNQSDYGYILVRSEQDTGATKTETRGYGSKRVSILITDDATMQPMVHRSTHHFAEVSASNDFDVKLVNVPYSGGRRIHSVQYSTDTGATWRRLCQNYPVGSNIRVSVGSDGNALAGGESVRLRYQTDYEYGFSPESTDVTIDATLGGRPVLLIAGQSNGVNMASSRGLENALEAYGPDVAQLNYAVGGSGATGNDAPWNVLGTGSNAGVHYDTMEAGVLQHLANNPNDYIASMAWIHGENDSLVGPGARANYVSIVTQLFADIQAAIGYDFPISVTNLSELQTNLPDVGREEMNVNFQTLADNLDNVYLVNTKTYIQQAGYTVADNINDGFHWTAPINGEIARNIAYEKAIRARYGISE